MIESVNFAKELMQTNRELRADIDAHAERADKAENEGFHLSTENRDLRDRIEILESVIGQSSLTTTAGDDFERLDWREIMAENTAPAVKTNNETVNEIINQLFTLKKDTARRDEANSALLSENNQLKQQISQMRAQQAA